MTTVVTDTDDRDRRRVGIGEHAVAETALLTTSGLGSCVGVALYDPAAGVGGLVHVMLPSSATGADGPDGKFADTGVEALLSAMTATGAQQPRIEAKLAGGSSMLDFASDDADIGERNVVAVREALDTHGIAVVESDVGGERGRSLTFDPTTGRLTIATGGETFHL
jgi:chemotaxis protein CheD